MAKAKVVSAVKIKKKVWCNILAPKEQNNVLLGETYVTEPQVAIGRTVHSNLKNITNSMRDQNVYIKFKITSVEGSNLHTEVYGYYITPSSLKKVVRRETSRIDDSFVVVTKDDKRVRIKPVVITFHKTVKSVGSAIRDSMRKYIAREVKQLDFNELIQKLITRQLHGGTKKKLSKTYPLKAFEIKVVEFAREGKTIEASEMSEEEKTESTQEKPKKAKKPKKTVSEEMQEEFDSSKDSSKQKLEDLYDLDDFNPEEKEE